MTSWLKTLLPRTNYISLIIYRITYNISTRSLSFCRKVTIYFGACFQFETSRREAPTQHRFKTNLVWNFKFQFFLDLLFSSRRPRLRSFFPHIFPSSKIGCLRIYSILPTFVCQIQVIWSVHWSYSKSVNS